MSGKRERSGDAAVDRQHAPAMKPAGSDPGRAIRPTIFDVYADPTLIMPMVLANLMSPALWRQADHLDMPGTSPSLLIRMRTIQGFLNRWLQHLSPNEVVAVDGTLDLADERARLGSAVVDRALDGIRQTVNWRSARGTLPPMDPLLALMDAGRFPAYVYGTIDELVAHRRLLGRPSGRPHALSSCLDEAALICAFLATRPVDDITGVAILGSAAHYTVLAWSGDPESPAFEAGWFYGKNTLLSHEDVQQIITTEYRGDAVTALADRLPDFDLIISRQGVWSLSGGQSSLSSGEREALALPLERFFGHRPTALASALAGSTTSVPDSSPDVREFDALLASCIGASGHQEVGQVISRSATPAARAVLACRRDVHSIGLESFHQAALRGTVLMQARRDAREGMPRPSIEGTASPFAEGTMLAMPEEVLRYQTGTELDRELLRWAISDQVGG